jgi:uracil-DNA glycosylase
MNRRLFKMSQNDIVACQRCPRLIEWCQAQEGKNPIYKKEKYWAKPVPGIGDPNGRLLIVGLAPGAHGANRTGIPFSGDTAGEFLFNALGRHGFYSEKSLTDVYITNAVKCAPPDNRPTSDEFNKCKDFLIKEIEDLQKIKVILAFGEKAFDQVKKVFRIPKSKTKFAHGVVHEEKNMPIIIGSYHTSKYNIDTKRMSVEKIDEIFTKVKSHLKD